MRVRAKVRRGMASLEGVIAVALSLPMAAFIFRLLSRALESLFYMIGTVVGSAYL